MLNTVNICGRLTASPELKTTESGISVLSFCVAVDGNTKEKHTDFINCVAWRGTAEFIAQYFTKGKMIIISGRLQTRSYTTQNGDKRTVTEVVVEQAFFAGDKAKSNVDDSDAVATDGFSELTDADDDVPF